MPHADVDLHDLAGLRVQGKDGDAAVVAVGPRIRIDGPALGYP